MEKQEFLDKLKEINFAPDNFEDLDYEDFQFSKETEEIARLKKEASDKLSNHPAYLNHTLRITDPTWKETLTMYSNTPNEWDAKRKEFLESKDIGDYSVVDSYGGEGQGDDYWKVLHFPKHDLYIRADGWYSSGGGSDMSSAKWYFVTPKEKTNTVYEHI